MKKYSDEELEDFSRCSIVIEIKDGNFTTTKTIDISDFSALLIQLAAYNHRKVTDSKI